MGRPAARPRDAGEPELLARCYRRSLELAREHDLTSIAFPAISTGVYGYPPAQAAQIAVGAVRETLADDDAIQQVVFCCFSEPSAAAHHSALEAVR